MKKAFQILAVASLILSLFFTSCGPSKKLVESQAKVNKLRMDSAYMQNKLSECNTQVSNLNTEKEKLQKDNAKVQNDLKALNSESKMTIADQAKRLQNLQNLIQAQRDAVNRLKNSISAALLNYSADELSVNIKDGNVYVSLQEKLLFKSGSDVVDPKGKEVLKSLAKVLNTTADFNVVIEGYTDNVPIKTKQYRDNWDLSTARATSIVRILTKDNGFDPNRIVASGRGMYHPVQANQTAEGRAANRRTEVILSPDLKELYKILEQ